MPHHPLPRRRAALAAALLATALPLSAVPAAALPAADAAAEAAREPLAPDAAAPAPAPEAERPARAHAAAPAHPAPPHVAREAQAGRAGAAGDGARSEAGRAEAARAEGGAGRAPGEAPPAERAAAERAATEHAMAEHAAAEHAATEHSGTEHSARAAEAREAPAGHPRPVRGAATAAAGAASRSATAEAARSQAASLVAPRRLAAEAIPAARPPAALLPGGAEAAPVRRVSATLTPALVVPHPLPAPVPMPGALPGASPVALPGALAAHPSPLTDAPLPAAPTVAAPLSAPATEVEVLRLRLAMAAAVPGTIRHTPDGDRRWLALLRPMLTGQNAPTHPQLVVVVDRNTRVQQAALVMVRPQGSWEVIGATHVSTGQAGRWDHYITPTGVFPHTDLILDYRAEGTFNENHIRGLGVKGMRVWDFGWQWAHRGWGEDQSPIQIRMEMHATDPSVLAQRIGHTASQGCIRIPEALNRFLDHYGVLDADYERAAVDDIRFRALLPKDREPTPLAGDTLVVVDSGA